MHKRLILFIIISFGFASIFMAMTFKEFNRTRLGILIEQTNDEFTPPYPKALINFYLLCCRGGTKDAKDNPIALVVATSDNEQQKNRLIKVFAHKGAPADEPYLNFGSPLYIQAVRCLHFNEPASTFALLLSLGANPDTVYRKNNLSTRGLIEKVLLHEKNSQAQSLQKLLPKHQNPLQSNGSFKTNP